MRESAVIMNSVLFSNVKVVISHFDVYSESGREDYRSVYRYGLVGQPGIIEILFPLTLTYNLNERCEC